MSGLTQLSDATGHVGEVPPDALAPAGLRRLRLLLIKPSKYDDDGYVMRFVRGVLPSNTLATLAGLTREVIRQGRLGSIEVDCSLLDETVQKVSPRQLARRYARRGTRTVVALCGVQTNQFPRAADLAIEFRKLGLPVLLGGFHVSGSIAMSPTGTPPECRRLMEHGVTLVKGEVEDCWDQLLRDALHDRLRTFYDITDSPDLSNAALPVVDRRLMRRFADSGMGTIDAGRGCPFNCSFCTIINVQGRKMRARPVEQIKALVRDNYARGIDYYFFTDDNFSRNPNWREIFDALVGLRRDEKLDIRFMMQVDVPAFRVDGFIERASEAGCTQVFIGMETVNPDNIPASGKRQNKVGDYREMIETWHAHGIACHVGYIIGFPHDTPESVRGDVLKLRDEIRVDQASFFMLMPIPGSRDHTDALLRGDDLDDDYNRYDSFHPAMPHPRMSPDEWTGAYRDAWDEFYSVEGMKSILERTADKSYWNVFKNFLWYRYATRVEDTHPMICGFFRLKDRKQRRPGHAVEGRWAHLRRRAGEIRQWTRGVVQLYYDMQEVWLATRGRPRWQQNVAQLRKKYEEMSEAGGRVVERGSRFVRHGGRVVQGGGLIVQHGSRFAIRLDPFRLRVRTRADLNEYWRQTRLKLRRGRLFRINPARVAFNLARDVRLCMRFNLELLAAPSR